MSQSKGAEFIQSYMDLFPERWGDNQAARDQYWRMLKIAKLDYFKIVKELGNDPDDESFYYYMQHTHGIKMILTNRNEITDQFEVTDAKKQMMFILKYGS